MNRFRLLSVFLLCITAFCKGQDQTVEFKEKRNSNNQYKDFAYDGNNIWSLTTTGKLKRFDANNGDPVPGNVKNNSTIIVITNDKEGNILIGDKSNKIKKFNKQTQTWNTLFKFDNTLFAITVDSKNNYYLITNKGIFDHTAKKYYYPNSSENFQIRHERGWFREPAVLADRNDNIWLGFGYGEWGGELFIFNTTDKKFITPNLKEFPITLNPIKSIFESKENVFATSGLMHFSTSGSILKFTNFESNLLFNSEDHTRFSNDSTIKKRIAGEYIGPGTYNEKDNCIYFYSQNGIFKGNPQTDLSKIENWTKVVDPKLHWSYGQPDAIGSPMNVLKLKFITPDKLIFVSQNDGIGIYNGKTLIMTR